MHAALVVVDMTFIGLSAFDFGSDSHRLARKANILTGTLFASVVATSITATFVICHHIYKSTTLNVRARRRYKHIVDILVQSSVMYTISVILVTICNFLDTGNVLSSVDAIVLEEYAQSISVVMTVSVCCETYIMDRQLFTNLCTIFKGTCTYAHGGAACCGIQ